MRLYHGSTVAVRKPLVARGRANTDFGKGFYTTTSKEQAEKWARIKKNRDGNAENARAIISVYEFDDSLLNDFNTMFFDGATVEWLDFVVANRRGRKEPEYDLIQGPVANDKLYATISLYESGVLDANAAIEQLRAHTLFDQLSFHAQPACNMLRFVESYELTY